MSTLKDGVTYVRSKLGEGRVWYFDNNSIIKDLNISAIKICSRAQFLRSTWSSVTGNITTNTTQFQGKPAQEYQMPGDCDVPTGAKINFGILYPLMLMPQEQIQIGGYVSAVPFSAYTRRGILLTSQVPGGGELVYAPSPTLARGNMSTWIIGFYPIPQSNYDFFVDYVQFHPPMVNPLDPCLIPDDFFDIWVSYAVAQGKEKEGDDQGADRYMQKFTSGLDMFKDKQAAAMTSMVPPMYGGGGNPLFSHGPGVLVMAPLNPTIEMP